MRFDDGVTLTVRFRALPGRAEDLRTALAELALASRKDAGCRRYDLFRRGEDDVLLLENWSARDLLDAHLAQEHVLRFQAGAGGLLAAAPEILEWEPFDLTKTRTEEK
ncbi:putative quinol monooxygenase [Paucidesulfovibrio longus]|uniref:putative quinol monooxygenase n=1 Tax=Paucidesulfovibrio longus TaxID=889 RepID=UPI0003B53629|nr:putative quinol monooxygenase [Paucidesulfovibrio longus]